MSDRPRLLSVDNASAATAVDTPDAGRLLAEAQRRWEAGEPADAAAVLSAHPELHWPKSLLLDLALDEYCHRVEAGEEVDASLFCRRFPEYQHSLRRTLEVYQYAEALETPVWPEVGDMLLDCRLVELLGEGSFARVYLAIQAAAGDRQVVLKVAPEAALEAQIQGQLRHANIVQMYWPTRDPESGLSVILMPFHGRSTLSDAIDARLVAGEPTPPTAARLLAAAAAGERDGDRLERVDAPVGLHPETRYVDAILRIGLQLAEALAHAHEAGILHGDLKPSNVILTPDAVPLLIDFNLARDAKLQQGIVGGTLPYMAPEQIRATLLPAADSQEEVGPPADLFSLGAILCELLTGRVPYPPPRPTGDLPHDAAVHVETICRQPPLLTNVAGEVDRHVNDVIERSLRADPAERPTSAAELAEQLRSLLSPRRRLARWCRRHRRQTTAGLLLVAASLLLLATWLALRPSYAVRQFRLGMQQFQAGQSDEAIHHFRQTITAWPENAAAWHWRGRARLASGDFGGARDDLLRAHEIAPDARHLAWIGNSYGQANQWHLAALKYRQAIEGIGPPNSALWNNLGVACLRSAQLEDGMDALDRAIELGTDSYTPYFNRAQAIVQLLDAGQMKYPAPAIADIRIAIERGPASSEIFYVAARLFHRQYEVTRDPRWAEECIEMLARVYQMPGRPVLTEESLAALFPAVCEDPRLHPVPASTDSGTPVKVQLLLDPADYESLED